MEKQPKSWKKLSEQELALIDGGGWFDDFKRGFQEGFDWAVGVIKDLAAAFK